MTPEVKVKNKAKQIFKKLGAYYAMPVSGGYGNSGVPDFVVCYQGYFFGIECKAGKGKPTALQYKNLNDIEASGGAALVLNEDNLPHLETFMNDFVNGRKQWTNNQPTTEV